MKKTITIILLVILSFAAIGIIQTARAETNNQHNIYADCGVIMENPDDTVTITLQNGHMFSFKNEDHDWFRGDLVTALFDDNGTEIITDDIILEVRYSGWISSAEIENWIK